MVLKTREEIFPNKNHYLYSWSLHLVRKISKKMVRIWDEFWMFHRPSSHQLPNLRQSSPKSTREAPQSTKLMASDLGSSSGKGWRTSESAAKIAPLKYHPDM